MPTTTPAPPLIRLLILALLTTLAACGDHDGTTATPPTPPMMPAPPADGPAIRKAAAARADATFLADLRAAFDATPWTRVTFTEELPDGAILGHPGSYAAGHYLAIAPVSGQPNPARADSFAAWVPAEEVPTPAGCILFRFAGAPAGSSFLVQTFLPAWIDADDLDTEHTTYRLDGAGDDLTLAHLKHHATPPTPWLLPPVSWIVTTDAPGRGGGGDWTVDPGEDPGDD